jgi:hypothetical protein
LVISQNIVGGVEQPLPILPLGFMQSFFLPSEKQIKDFIIVQLYHLLAWLKPQWLVVVVIVSA